MTQPLPAIRARISALVSSGALTASEAGRLAGQMNRPEGPRSLFTIEQLAVQRAQGLLAPEAFIELKQALIPPPVEGSETEPEWALTSPEAAAGARPGSTAPQDIPDAVEPATAEAGPAGPVGMLPPPPVLHPTGGTPGVDIYGSDDGTVLADAAPVSGNWPPPPVTETAGPAVPPPPLSRPAPFTAVSSPYPVSVEIAFPPRLSRLSTLFRPLLAVPVLLLWPAIVAIGVLAVLVARWATFLKRTYPDWLQAAVVGSLAFEVRLLAYLSLVTDHYPSFSRTAAHPVQVEVRSPAEGQASRWNGLLWRLVLTVLHGLVLQFLSLGVVAVSVINWFAILFTGRPPAGLFGFVEGYIRWTYRVRAYQMLLTDDFPPFAFSAEAARAGRAGYGLSLAAGLAYGGIYSIALVAAAFDGSQSTETTVAYEELRGGRPVNDVVFADGVRWNVTLQLVDDPAPANASITPDSGERLVVFEWLVETRRSDTGSLAADAVVLRARNGDQSRRYEPELILVGSRAAPETFRRSTAVRALLIIPDDAVPERLTFALEGGEAVRYEFR